MFTRAARDPKRSPFRLLFVPAVLLAAGCADPGADTTTAKLQKIGNFYGPYCLAHNMCGPANDAQFRDYIRSCPTIQLQALDVNTDNLDPLFTSDRDQQPFVLRFGLPLAGAGGKVSKQVFAYEQTGKGGRRLALYTTGKVELLDAAASRELK